MTGPRGGALSSTSEKPSEERASHTREVAVTPAMCQPDPKFLAQPAGGAPARVSRALPGPRARRWLLAVVALGAVLSACESVPEGPESDPEALAVAPGSFSARAAWHHLQTLTRIGARQTGTRGSARARSYLRQQLESLGANVEELTLTLPALAEDEEPREVIHLVGTLPGESSDRFLLAASYDTRALPGIEFIGANASASGPALVLELARALSERPRPYTVVVALVDGDGLPVTQPGATFPGSRSFASWLAEEANGGFAKIRLAVFFQQVADLDLSIARDLRSHPIYREFFWEAAGVLGREIYFPANANVESVDAGHLELIGQGLPRSVVIADPRYGGSDIPGRYAGTEADTLERCSRDSLGIVGDVALEALDRISARLARIDRFHRSPLWDPAGTDGAAPARMADPTGPQAPVEASDSD